jgi:hypothetical protein
MYKLVKTGNGYNINIVGTNIYIPFDPANTDYANFKKDLVEGAELLDSDGNVMTHEQADAYIATLP